ncbi:MAG: alginate lyase family protein [Flaviaesturariibacter sp.]|nr:alginate lyase family protein [Flaviaesturariibacter sp.]
MRIPIAVFTLLVLGCAPTRKSASQAPPRVFILDGMRLQENRRKLTGQDPALLPAYQQLRREADKALNEGPFSVMEKTNLPPSGDKHDYMSLAPYFWPDPTKKDGLPYIRKDGVTNPEVKLYKDKEYMPLLCSLVHTLSLAYYFSGEEKYAAHASNLLRMWFLDPATRMNPNLNFAQAIRGVNEGRGAGLIDARHFMKVVDAIGLLQSSKAWRPADQDGMKQWCASFVHWMQTSPVGLDELDARNNHGTFYDALRLSMALFIDSSDLAKKIVVSARERLDYQMDAEGKFPKEMERTIALHYNTFNLDAFYMVARMAESTGLDLWNYVSPNGNSLRKGFTFLGPYLAREKKWEGQQIKPFDFNEGYGILLQSASKLGCTTCRSAVQKLAGNEAPLLLENLLY